MTMLKIEDYRPAYTLRKILECDYPELLETAESGCAILTELQNALVELLPQSQKLLPREIKQLSNIEAQANLMTYIYHHSLFAFTNKVYTILKEQCTALAKALNANNAEDEDKAVEELKKTLEALSNMPFDNMLEQSAVGLLRLNIFKDYLQDKFDFNVIPVFKANGELLGNWSFRDITGTIVKNGLTCEALLTDCTNTPLPSTTTIGQLVDNEKMVRIY